MRSLPLAPRSLTIAFPDKRTACIPVRQGYSLGTPNARFPFHRGAIEMRYATIAIGVMLLSVPV
jgi:hypothetical protein